MANVLKVGRVVQLRSGGPKMTVTKVGVTQGTATAWCAWFDGSEAKTGSWPESALIGQASPQGNPVRNTATGQNEPRQGG